MCQKFNYLNVKANFDCMFFFIVIKLKITNSDTSYVVRYVRHTDFRNYEIYLNCNIFNSVADRKSIINTNN